MAILHSILHSRDPFGRAPVPLKEQLLFGKTTFPLFFYLVYEDIDLTLDRMEIKILQ
jgi:hypothetical protein